MSNTMNLLLSIDVTQDYDTKLLKEQLDLALDWLRVVPGTYFLYTNSDVDKWFNRIKKALPNNRFMITKIDISNNDYVGYLPTEKWDWIRQYR